MGKFETVNEVKSVTAHEVINITIVYPLRAVKKALIYGGLEYPKA